MHENWVTASVETRDQDSTRSPLSTGSPPVPRYSQMVWRGVPPRLHFHMVDEPDAATAAQNCNGLTVLLDKKFGKDSLWSPRLFEKWKETIATVSTPTKINEAMHGGAGDLTLQQLRIRDSDEYTGYLWGEELNSQDIQHFHCDVDTTTGNLLPPLKHPRTLPAPLHRSEAFEPDRKDRTSEDLIMQKVTRHLTGKSSKKSCPQRAYQDAIVAMEDDLRRKPMKPMVGHLYLVPGAVSFRPAVPADTDAIANIYNAEVMGAGMAPDSKPVSATSYQQILKACQANKKPFIIAVKNANPLADVSNWPDRTALEDWMRLKRAQGEAIDKEEAVGFAFLSPFDYGIWGSEGNAQYSAKIRCFVSPEQRRQGIGRALVDLMLQMTVTGYSAKCDSTWKHTQPSDVFNTEAFKNRKKYHRIFVEVYFKNKGDPAFEGLKTLLENQIGFTSMGHILGAYITERGEESLWLDKHIWGIDAVHQDEVGWYKADVREKVAW